MSQIKSFFTGLNQITAKDSRYKEDAYLFLMTALNHVLQKLKEPRHITGQELLGGIREEAGSQFGPMASVVFEYWGIKNSLDFGRIVFNMVEEGMLSKTETDTLEDFRDDLFFQKLFDEASAYRLSV